MKAIDTNVLVRFLVKDDERQSEIVYRVFRQAEMDKNTFFVPLLVVLETLWVLDSVYNIARNGILDSINEVLLMPILKFEAQATIQRFIFLARETEYATRYIWSVLGHPGKHCLVQTHILRLMAE